MENIVDFESLKRKQEEKNIENLVDNICGSIIADTLILLTQEINATLHYTKDSEYDLKKTGEVLRSAVSEEDSIYFADLLYKHGKNLQTVADEFLKGTATGEKQRKLKDLYGKKMILKPSLIGTVEDVYKQALERAFESVGVKNNDVSADVIQTE